jgi:hypothetical protein
MDDNTTNTPKISSHKRRCEDKHFYAQKKRVFEAFQQPKTMLMVSVETGILRANICRYIAEWQKENRICIVREGICPISKHRAGYYCTAAIVEPSKIDSHE